MNGACVLRRFKGERCGGLTFFDLSEGRGTTRIFRGKNAATSVLVTLSTVDRMSVAPGSALVMLSRVRSYPGTLRTLGFFYRSTPSVRVVITKSLLKVSLRDKISCPMKGMRRLHLCPVGFVRFLSTVKGTGLTDVLGRKG